MENRKQYDINLHTFETVLDFKFSISIPAVVMCQSSNRTIDQLRKMFSDSQLHIYILCVLVTL